MPGFKTHSIFGILTEKKIPDSYIKQCINEYPRSFQMGLQGPDFLFYYAPAHILYKNNPGDIMHASNVGSFFKKIMELRDTVSESDSMLLDSYICGFLGHYTLDTAIHPYIYYRTNHMNHLHEKTYDFGIHSFLETDIDQACLRHYLKTDILDYKPWQKIAMSHHEADVISSFMMTAISSVYPNISINKFMIKKAFKSMSLEQYLMRDPSGRKKRFMRRIDERTVRHAFISPLIPYHGKPKYKDPCNLSHRKWNNPWNKRIRSSKDIYMLMEESRDLLIKRISLYVDYIQKKEGSEKLLNNLGNKSYLTGLELE